MVRPSTPSLALSRVRPCGSIAGMPWGITTGTRVMPYSAARTSMAVAAMTTSSSLRSAIERTASRTDRGGSGSTVCRVVITGLRMVSRNSRRWSS